MQGEKLEKGTIKAIQSLRKDGVSARKTAILLNVGVLVVAVRAALDDGKVC